MSDRCEATLKHDHGHSRCFHEPDHEGEHEGDCNLCFDLDDEIVVLHWSAMHEDRTVRR